MSLMMTLISAATALALRAAPSGQQDPFLFPSCKGISVTLRSHALTMIRGEAPKFAILVSNETNRPASILDVRNDRRADLQHTYFELFVVRGKRAVETPIAISDPGPLSAADFLELGPGERVEIPRISYTRELEGLRPGRYEAFILFWRDPMDSATRCRSTSAFFTVQQRSRPDNGRHPTPSDGPIARLAGELRGVQDDDAGRIPKQVQRLLPQLRHAIAQFVVDTLNSRPSSVVSETEAQIEKDLLGDLQAQVAESASGPYAYSAEVGLTEIPSTSDVLVAAITISVQCGTDTSLHVLARRSGKWRHVRTIASKPSSSITAFWGQLKYAAAPLTSEGNFLLVLGNITPWCTSNWQRLRYSAYQVGIDGHVRRLFSDYRTIYIGVDEPVFRVTVAGSEFEFAFHGPSLGEPGASEHTIRYIVTTAGVELKDEMPRRDLPRR